MTAPTSKMKKLLATSFVVASVILSSGAVHAAKVDGDSRIKTLIFNDNEVFRVVMRNGFQTDVELSADETIDTLSIGDSIGWQITPASHRLFIKPLQRSGVTNLSVITNKRTYQFELVAINPTNSSGDHAYVVKFYYPDSENAAPAPIDRTRGFTRPVSQTAIPELPVAPTPTLPIPEKATPPLLPGDIAPAFTPEPAPVAPTPPAALPTPAVLPGDMKAPPVAFNPNGDAYNFNYTLSGPEEIAPAKIYDDGRSTFFQFNGTPSPALNFARVLADGSEVPVPARTESDGKVIVDQLGSKFTIREGTNLVCIFNEQQGTAPTAARP